MMTDILTPFDSPDFIPLRNRAVMSAMSRGFADGEHRPTAAVLEYYRRRAQDGAGLILTEGTIIHPTGDGWNNAPHIANNDQARAWTKVVDAVHSVGGSIACQLWHCGRISHSDYTGGPPVSSTNRAAAGMNRQNGKPYGEPRALEISEMPAVIGYYREAAKRALDAGFDAIELHTGHGYLIDQFLDANVNDRIDRYGGTVENRCRLMIELLTEIFKEVPANRVIARISPSRFMGGLYEWPDLDEMIEYLIPTLADIGLKALDVSCANSNYFETSGKIVRKIRPHWRGVLMGGASLTLDQANSELDEGLLDLVTWGRAFIANSDLVQKFTRGEEPTPFDDSMRDTLA